MLSPVIGIVLKEAFEEAQKVRFINSVYGVQMVALCVIGALGVTALVVGGSTAEVIAVAVAGGMGTIIGILFKNKVTEV